MTEPLTALPEPTPDWNARAVDAPGGHVYQSVEWAEHRRAAGWGPVYLAGGDHRVLALTRRWPLVGGGSAYIPRGPASVADAEAIGATLWEATRALAADGIDVVAADPEVPASDEAYRTWLRRGRFHPIEEIQPSRHRLTLPLGRGADEAAVFDGIAKSTRQRIRKAEKTVAVVRFDCGGMLGSDGTHGTAGSGGTAETGEFAAPVEPAEVALDRFYDLLLETGERRDFSFGPRADFVAWWRRAHAAGHLVYLEAHADDPAGEVLAGLVLYRHGGRLSTVHSGDRAGSRRSHPGSLHLLRWRAIQLALREGRDEMDLGGVDVAGARRAPVEGEPMYGLYQHKLSFGARWLELAGAHERVIRPRRYRVGRTLAGGLRLGRRAGQRVLSRLGS